MSDGDDVLKPSKHHDLRTRIAAVLNSFPADMRPVEVVNLEKADAVIRELGLQECDDQDCRYVTEWIDE